MPVSDLINHNIAKTDLLPQTSVTAIDQSMFREKVNKWAECSLPRSHEISLGIPIWQCNMIYKRH